MILTKRFVIIFINTMIGYQLGNLVLVKRCTTDGTNYTQSMATKTVFHSNFKDFFLN